MSEEKWLATYIFKDRPESDARDLANRFANASAVIRTKFFLWMFTQPPLRDAALSRHVATLLRDKAIPGSKAWRAVMGAAHFDYDRADSRSAKHFAAMAALQPFNVEVVIRAAAGIVIYGEATAALADAATDKFNERITAKIVELLKETT